MKKPTIALFLHHPRGSVQCGNAIMQACQDHYNFKIFTRHELERDFFDDVDCVAFPGGVGDADSWDWLLATNGKRIRDYISNGGRYLGICMGAYWADPDYFDILNGVRAVQYIQRPNTDTRRPHPKAISITWDGLPDRMYFYDGCALVGDETTFTTVSRYANGDPMAIIQNRVGLIGCHPESRQFWYDRRYLEPHWHQGRHHDLLLDFVNRLMRT
jgi:hypothetical protein